jgi:hypothetical protein
MARYYDEYVFSFAKIVLFPVAKKTPDRTPSAPGCGPDQEILPGGVYQSAAHSARSGHFSAALQTIRPMNSRRLTFSPPRVRAAMVATPAGARKGSAHVRFGSEADMCSAKGHVRFTPESDRESGHAANGHVCFTPKSGLMQCNSQCLLWAQSGHHDLLSAESSGASEAEGIILGREVRKWDAQFADESC